MGWPRKTRYVLYYERRDKSYMLVDKQQRNVSGDYEAVCNAVQSENPNLCTSPVDPMYLYTHCNRVDWHELPEIWQMAFSRYFGNVDIKKDVEFRGFFRTERKD